MSDVIRVLLVEDDEDDFLITKDVLDDIPGRSVVLDWCEDYESAFARLLEGECDICFVDYRIGGETGIDFVERARAADLRTPLVLLTGVGQRDIDVAATRAGASDYLDKSELNPALLERTIRYSIAHAQALQALGEKTDLLQTTLENAGAGLAAFDASGTCLAVNSRFSGMLADLSGSESDEETSENLAAFVMDAVADGMIANGGTELCARSGSVYEVSRTTTPQGIEVYVSIDVTAQKAARDALLRARRDAEAASRAKSSFFANMSHELRTPLQHIIGYSDLIANAPQNDDVATHARQVHESGMSLLGIINTVIRFSCVEAGHHVLRNDRICDLRFFVGDLVKPIRRDADARGIAITVEVDERITALEGDQVAIGEIITNLVHNAVRFTDDGGEIGVKLRITQDFAVELAVTDNGIGIAPEKCERVFDAFYQADDSLDRSFEGIGLGLPLVKLLGERHQAEVSLHSVLGEGTKITIRFPPQRCVIANAGKALPGSCATA